MQMRHNSFVDAKELCLFCIKPLKWFHSPTPDEEYTPTIMVTVCKLCIFHTQELKSMVLRFIATGKDNVYQSYNLSYDFYKYINYDLNLFIIKYLKHFVYSNLYISKECLQIPLRWYITGAICKSTPFIRGLYKVFSNFSAWYIQCIRDWRLLIAVPVALIHNILSIVVSTANSS